MKNRALIIIFITILLIGAAIQFIPFNLIVNILKSDSSADGIIEKSTFLNYQNKFQFLKILAIFFPLFCLIFVVCFRRIGNIQIKIIQSNSIQFIKNKWLGFYSRINSPKLFWFSLTFILFLAIFAVIKFDIGQDEAFFLNDIQNIKNHGSIYRDVGDNSFYYFIPNLPLNIIVRISVPLFGFSVLHIRLIILIFSILLMISLIKLFDKEIGLILIPLIFLFPGIFYLTSAVHLETTALLFVVLGLIFLKRSEKKENSKDLIISATFVAVAMATKFQLLVWVALILLILMIVDYKKSAIFIFKYFLTTYSFFLILLILNCLCLGIVDGILLIKSYLIDLGGSEAFSFNFSKLINKSLFFNELIFIPLIVFIWAKSWRIAKEEYDYLYMKFIYIGAIVIVLHWILFHSVITWRNVFIGVVFNAVLFAIFLRKNYRETKLIFISYIIIGIIANYGFVKNGVLDDVQYYRAHLLDNMLSLRTKDDQKLFFHDISKIIKSEDIVYAPMQLFIPRLYLNNREIRYFKDYKKSDKRAYLIVFAGAVKENYVDKKGLRKYIDNSKIVLKRGNYTLYEFQ